VRRPAARLPRRVAGALIALAACADDGPRDAAPRVVDVAAQPCRRPTADLGRGVVVADGLVLTAAHVVDGPRRTVEVDDHPAQVVGLDDRTDLALLAAPVTGPAVELGAPSAAAQSVVDASVRVLRSGPLVVHDATTGEVHRRDVHTFRPMVVPGTSGSPLLDDRGRLLGIVVLDNRTNGTAYAVTAAEIGRFLRQPGIPDAPSECVG
jgi:S1-C subfamily serine protease